MMLGAQKNDDPTVTALLMLSLKKFIITDLNTYLSNEHCIAVDEIDDKHIVSLFRKKRFEINFFVRRNASKFAIFIEKENPRSFI